MAIDTNSQNNKVVVVMVPFPAQGHLNQLLHLSRLIASYNDIHLHYVGSSTHNRQAKLRIHGWNPNAIDRLHFHDFLTPHFISPPPNPNTSNKFPSHLIPSFEASSQLREPVGALLANLSLKARRVIVIHDSLMASVVQDVAKIPNAESYTLHTVSAFAMFFYIWEAMGRPFPVEESLLRDIPSMEGRFSPEFVEFVTTQHDHMNINSGRLFNTSKAIEAPYLDLLSKEEISKNKPHWALGPFNPVVTTKTHDREPNKRHRCLEWLDKQDSKTVLFVSFGTTTSFREEQIKELAIGLERSDQKFIWVLRDADKGDVFSDKEKRSIQLPKGYEEKLRENGMGTVVRDWAPQLEILGHPATGGFMSHCGWNSCIESISMGVPIAAWPMHSDQPMNSVLVTKLLKIGIVVREWGKRDELITSYMIEKAVKRLMATEEGEEVRERARNLGGVVRMSAEMEMEMDSFISHIIR